MPGAHWSDEEKAALIEAIQEGATTRELVAELGRGHRAIERMRQRIAPRVVSGRRPDVDKRVRVLGMLADGLSMYRISRRLGVCDSSVQRMCRLMVRDGLLKRVGENPRNVRYIPTNDRELRQVSAVNLGRVA